MQFNCDMGESFGPWVMGNDEAVMPHIDMANIACGFHASDPVHMHRTIALASQHLVRIGAHPGYPDLQGFGRRAMALSREELFTSLLYQMGALDALCKAQGTSVSYMKPHGALYNQMMQDDAILDTVLASAAAFKPHCSVVVMAGVNDDKCRQLAKQHGGVPLLFEAFCDRLYNDDGTLVSRTHPDAVHGSIEQVINQVRGIVKHQTVTTISGKQRPLKADTICLHGDNTHLLQEIARIKDCLKP
ncbi:5-oxoprolinase subunit PxpA [Parendozoicomonas haliclonae]|uniref:LamB/YcsF family protein n=1 Tax=Parendozoicomonas haliclonae TaxID=1960125 RepID=A0A1X7AH62_9GAMM|nr:5-oxoprolinase subunit PxpA [Parendozoicomonas haliclonae]SMA42023.1 LamB/YcsF family protein [Parendozoicomonas haliclonae]